MAIWGQPPVLGCQVVEREGLKILMLGAGGVQSKAGAIRATSTLIERFQSGARSTSLAPGRGLPPIRSPQGGLGDQLQRTNGSLA